ncbi:type IX secretion system membrane protein PorP/SprF [uncultured Nonlabens sp.]|uniref:PorP/SprF family type IX secretion system membrane protein n=1 Tax=uncultured Nonlabens sp. TaxID=859306 RepID=UPI0026073BC0|nr:type IX secretion system membrane protein PorP/SprF [uncultured Nonlabens sp.]
MKKLYIKQLLITLVFAISLSSVAQQDPQFTQYMYNQSIINPAYATANKSELNIGGLYRSQWVGLEGAPKTASLFVHYPVSDRVEVGISFTNDDIGNVVTENNIYADFAYVLPVSETAKLSLGLKAGVTLFDANFDGFNLQSGGRITDPAFNDNVTQSFPNIGLGAFYFTDKFYVGLSAPNLLTTTHLENENGIQSTGVQDVHFFLNSGYVINLNPDLKFKPSFLLKGVKGAPLSADINANFLFYDKFEAGLGYRIDDSVSALVNYKVTPELRLGYAYDYTTSNLGSYNSGSHEIILLYNIKTKFWKSGYDRSPRFF